MSIIQLLSKMQVLLGRDSLFTVPAEQQLSYLNKLPEPKDDLERGYCQYRCQAMLRGRIKNSIASIGSFPVALILMTKYAKAAVPEKVTMKPESAVFFRDGKPANIMPETLGKEFSECIIDPVEGNLLQKQDLRLIWELICRHPLSWQFVLKCIIKIARYRYAIEKYGIEYIVVCNEYSFTSSVLTEFCARNQVELINVMHGEKLLHIRDSFFHFHRCYVWDEHYVNLFKTMRAEETQFRVAIPDSLRFCVAEAPEKCYDYTVYLGSEDREALTKLHNVLAALKERGAEVNVRPHPRYTDKTVLAELYTDFHVEDPTVETIEMSVLKSRSVISQFSTVLLQAYCNGISVVIDDITNPERFAKLKELRYIMMSVDHKLLSAVERR